MPAFTLTPGSPPLTIAATGNKLTITHIDGGTAAIAGGGGHTPTLSQMGSTHVLYVLNPNSFTLAAGNTYNLSSGSHTLVGSY